MIPVILSFFVLTQSDHPYKSSEALKLFKSTVILSQVFQEMLLDEIELVKRTGKSLNQDQELLAITSENDNASTK